MSAALALAEAVTALVAEKRAVGYTYDTEARVLARFEASSRREFPGVDSLTEVSVNAWIAAAHRREVKPATLQILAAPVRELAREMRTTERGFASHRPPQQTVASHPRAWHSGNTVKSMYQVEALHMLVAFAVWPNGGTGDGFVREAVAAAVEVVRASGLPNHTDSMFTTIEGDWDEVFDVIHQAADAVSAYGPRVDLVLKADIRPGHTDQLNAQTVHLQQRIAEDS